ncbi:MAG: DegV family protein [Thermoflexales bacterium]
MPSRRPVCIVTDSAARLPLSWTSQYPLVILPHLVSFDAEHWLREDVDLNEHELACWLRQTPTPFTVRAPSVEQFIETYQALDKQHVDVLSLHVSAALSEAIANAQQARARFLGSCNIHIFDSGTAALGLHMMVRDALRLLESGCTLDEVVTKLRFLRQTAYGYFVSDELLWLKRSGRLRPSQAVISMMMGIIPCLTFEQGDLVAVEKVRHMEQAIEKVAEFAVEFDSNAYCVLTQLCPTANRLPQLTKLANALNAFSPAFKRDMPVWSCGVTLGRLLGPRGFGFMAYEGDVAKVA